MPLPRVKLWWWWGGGAEETTSFRLVTFPHGSNRRHGSVITFATEALNESRKSRPDSYHYWPGTYHWTNAAAVKGQTVKALLQDQNDILSKCPTFYVT